MYGFPDDDKPVIKCYATHGLLPTFIDRAQPPTRKKPFSTIRAQPFNHTVELILPEEAWNSVSDRLLPTLGHIQYSHVTLRLSDLLEGGLFAKYIKQGSIVMISEGRVGLDETFSLCDGILRLLLDKESYERAGLVGKPHGSVGMKRSRARWMVEINLRMPSMLHGKKGFERIVWAFKNVLAQSLTWLVLDLNSGDGGTTTTTLGAEIERHHPDTTSCGPLISRTSPTRVPPLHPPPPGEQDDVHLDSAAFDSHVTDLYEWLSLVSLASPRILQSDEIDPYLSRYEVPGAEEAGTTSLVHVRWKGFLPSKWIASTWMNTLLELRELAPKSWFAFSVGGFDVGNPTGGRNYTILRLPPSASDQYGSVTAGPCVASTPAVSGTPTAHAQQTPKEGATQVLPKTTSSTHPDSFILWSLDER